MLKLPKDPMSCHEMKEGIGFKQKCLNASFHISYSRIKGVSYTCDACGKSYNLNELLEINKEKISD